MQLSGKLTQADLRDLGKLTGSWKEWMKLILTNLYSIVILGALVVATVSDVMHPKQANWLGIALIWLALGGLVAWPIFSSIRKRVGRLAKLNALLPDQLDLSTGGIKFDGPNGASAFLPWGHFKGWREGQRLLLLNQRDANQIVIVPVGDLSDVQRQPVRDLLRASIPPTR